MGKTIAIIPARGGSKRIPRKNIKHFLGKPIIAYSIEAALKSGIFNEVMVSTDDDEIAQEAVKYGAKVPFMRSKENASDLAGTTPVLLEVIEEYKKRKEFFTYGCCIYPCAPFITGNLLQSAFLKLKKEHKDFIFPVVKYTTPIQRAFKFGSDKIEMFYPEYLNTRSQDLEPAYFDAGQFYFFDVNALERERKMLTQNTTGIIIDDMLAQDIDNEADWKIAEIKYKLHFNND